MAEIRAFRGTFYNPLVVEDLSRVVAPPYDVIDGERKRQLLSRSPYNIVRLILPQSEGERDFWNTSAALFRAWKKGEVMVADGEASLYVYRQTFGLPGSETASRTGILAALRCRDFSGGEILPHEKTFPRVRVERLNLLRACRANFSQVFTVFKDPEEELLPLLQEVTCGPAFLAFRDDEGVGHQLWRVKEPLELDRLAGMVRGKRLIIADGHHRYETALAYSGEEPAARAEQPRAYVSVALYRSEDPGLVILPVHRLLRSLPLPAREVYGRLERFFHVEVIRRDPGMRQGMFRDELEGCGRPCFIMVTREGAARLVLREGVEPSRVIRGPESARWKSLDVPILHTLVLGEGLGLDADVLAERAELSFTPWESAVVSGIEGGEAEAAFIVGPTRIEDIWEIAEGGERMPHKSSYFYPKLPSGLVLYDHETALA